MVVPIVEMSELEIDEGLHVRRLDLDDHEDEDDNQEDNG